MSKICIDCHESKTLNDFPMDKTRKSGFKEVCKACRCIRRKAAYNKASRAKESERYYSKNKVKILAYAKKWRERNKEKVLADAKHYMKKRRASDPQFKLICNLRTRLYCAVRNNAKMGSAVIDLGCSIPEFKAYLESKFQPGMTWENYGQWHIDHIKPLISFDLGQRDQFLKAVHFTNLQPLWARDNILKRHKVPA